MKKILTKRPWMSKTIAFFTLVALGGGLNLLEAFINNGAYTWQDVALFAVSLVGLALRVVTDKPLTLK